MRDAVMEALASEQARMDAYERKCPICDECGTRLTADDYYYDFNSTIMCERCVMSYRRNIEDYANG